MSYICTVDWNIKTLEDGTEVITNFWEWFNYWKNKDVIQSVSHDNQLRAERKQAKTSGGASTLRDESFIPGSDETDY